MVFNKKDVILRLNKHGYFMEEHKVWSDVVGKEVWKISNKDKSIIYYAFNLTEVGYWSINGCKFLQRFFLNEQLYLKEKERYNLLGKKFGKLTVIGMPKRKGSLVYTVRCECGNIKEIHRKFLLDYSLSSCGCSKGGKTHSKKIEGCINIEQLIGLQRYKGIQLIKNKYEINELEATSIYDEWRHDFIYNRGKGYVLDKYNKKKKKELLV